MANVTADDDRQRFTPPPGWRHEPQDLQHALERLEDTHALLCDVLDKSACVLDDLAQFWDFRTDPTAPADTQALLELIHVVQRRVADEPGA